MNTTDTKDTAAKKPAGSPADAISTKVSKPKAPAKKAAAPTKAPAAPKADPAPAEPIADYVDNGEIASPEAIDAVNAYLEYVADNTTIVDTDAIAQAEAALEAATTQLEKLRAKGALNRAKVTDPTAVTEAFIDHAANFAAAESLTAADFRELGVPANILAEAGVPKGSGGSRKPRATIEAVTEAMVKLNGNWSLRDLETASDASGGLARRAVDAAIEAGLVKDVGPDPDHVGRGRAAVLYTNS